VITIPGRKHKYGARKTEYGGQMYDSAAEANRAAELDILKRCGKIQSWERQVSFPIVVNGRHVCKFVVDFRVIESPARNFLEEIKGVETAVYKLKLKLFRACYPDLALYVVKV